MKRHLKNYLISMAVYLVLDVIWLNLTLNGIYRNKIGNILNDKVNYGAACLLYIVFIFGLVFFVVNKAVDNSNIKYAAIGGATYGLVTYGTFDFTSQAIIKDWSWFITGVDLLWGMFIASAVAVVSYLVLKKL